MQNYLKQTFFALLIALMLVPFPVLADQGKVLKVIDGDTFLAEVAGKGGAETIEVNLRCSDAPVLDSLFGQESKQFLEKLLGASDQVHYKVQAFCGSKSCVEALAYIPDPVSPETTYLNTMMIEAGMARNNSCRGVFADAEAQAKSGKLGIWSTSKRISFVDTKTEAEPKQVTSSAPKAVQSTEMAPAVIKYDRVARTVTIQSPKVSLTRIVKALDAVAPTPINIYLQQEQYLSLNLEKVHWYKALQRVVETADLRQVNMDGNIDLYTRQFYDKHVSPYLKISGNVGVYMSAGSSVPSEPVKDDGTTRYVFINEFENSAEVAQQYKMAKELNQSSGFIQVHQGSSKAPVSDSGTFSRTGQPSPVKVAAAEPIKEVVPTPAAPVVVSAPAVPREQLKPYSGEKAVVEEPPIKVPAQPVTKVVQPTPVVEPAVAPQEKTAVTPAAAPDEKVVAPVVDQQESVVAAKVVEEEIVRSTETPMDEKAASAPQTEAPEAETKAAPVPSEIKGAEASDVAIEFSLVHAAALVLIVLVVVLGCFYLTRSAGAKAAAAEKHVEPEDLEEPDAGFELEVDAQVDKAYEEEIFDELEHVGDSVADLDAGKIFDQEPDEAEPAEETATPDAADTDLASTGDIEAEDPDTSAQGHDDLAADEVPAEAKTEKISEKKIKTKLANDGDFSVPVESYHDLINGPEREPRKICLFEVKCTHAGRSFTGIGLDIGSGGLFVDSKEKLEVGTVIELEYKLFEEIDESIRCRGAVTWYNQRPDPIKPDYPNGFGVRFLEIEAATLAAIEEFLAPGDE